ncbi:hypothetical protein [uncultured Psychrobacter sp.]|uniref:hypothetical protein n=1 Tax=uncultured Psychrobacter sp. TaxID=259303 RepID=UPI00345A45DB
MRNQLKLWIESLNFREVNFVLFILKDYYPEIIIPNSNAYLLSKINKSIADNILLSGNIENLTIERMVPEESFGWIRNSLRASLWLYDYYSKYLHVKVPKYFSHFHSDFLDNLIFNIDIAYFTNQSFNSSYLNQSQNINDKYSQPQQPQSRYPKFGSKHQQQSYGHPIPQGYPQPYPQQSYPMPPQGYPQPQGHSQPYPQQGYLMPPQGYPQPQGHSQPYPKQGYPMPPQGYPQPYPQQGYPMPPQGYPQPHPQQGYPMPPQGYPQPHPQQGYPMPPQGYPKFKGVDKPLSPPTLKFPEFDQNKKKQFYKPISPNQPFLINSTRTEPIQTQYNNSAHTQQNNLPSILQCNFATQEKILYLNEAKMIYTTILTDRSDIQWLNTNNDEQIYWAAEYLKKNDKLIMPPLFIAYNTNDMLEQVCASLDALDSKFIVTRQNYRESPDKAVFISRMRKAWSQKKFRDKKDTDAAQDLLLPRSTKKKLMDLAEGYGTDSIEVLCDIIDQAYKNTYHKN